MNNMLKLGFLTTLVSLFFTGLANAAVTVERTEDHSNYFFTMTNSDVNTVFVSYQVNGGKVYVIKLVRFVPFKFAYMKHLSPHTKPILAFQ
jgi:hypothetical protein